MKTLTKLGLMFAIAVNIYLGKVDLDRGNTGRVFLHSAIIALGVGILAISFRPGRKLPEPSKQSAGIRRIGTTESHNTDEDE